MLVLIVTFGTGLEVIPTLAFFYGIPVRIARAATHDMIARDFVWAAKARGHSRISIIWRELLPNVLDTLMVEGAMRWSWMPLAFSSLASSFGVSPPTPDWGLMIDARGYMSFAPWGVIGPVVALSSLIIGINSDQLMYNKALGIDRAQKAPMMSAPAFINIHNSLLAPARAVRLFACCATSACRSTVRRASDRWVVSGSMKKHAGTAIGFFKRGLRALKGELAFDGIDMLALERDDLQAIRVGVLR